MANKKTARPEMSWIANRNQWRKRVVIDGKSRDIYGKTQDEVRAKLKELEQQADAGLALDNRITLVQFAREWYPVKVAHLRAKSAQVYANAINAHIAPHFQDMRLADVKPLNVQKFMAEKAKLSRSSQGKILRTLSQIFESAEQNGMVKSNPCKKLKAGGAPSKPKTPLTDEQQAELVAGVRGTRAELFVLLGLFAGLRCEETLGLLWSDVHLGAMPYIDVRHTMTFPTSNQGVFSDELKSEAARRSIPIPLILADALAEARPKTESIFVVTSVQKPGTMSYTAYLRMWDIAKGAVGFHVTSHLLRHTYLTELCASGLDIKKIQYLAGHEDVKMTLSVYAHVKDNQPEQLSADIINIFSGSNPGANKQAEM